MNSSEKSSGGKQRLYVQTITAGGVAKTITAEMAIVLLEDGRLEWRLFERQGMRRDDLVHIFEEGGKFIINVFPTLIEKGAELLPLIAAL